MADTLPAYSSAFLVAVAPLLEVARAASPSDRPSELTEPEKGRNIFLQNEPNLCPETLDLFGFAY